MASSINQKRHELHVTSAMKTNKLPSTAFLILAAFLAVTPSAVSSFLANGSCHSKQGLAQRYAQPVTHSRLPPPLSIDNVLKWRGGSNKKGLNPFSSTTARDASLQQFAGPASNLFGNMITPASILCGAIIPLCFASGLDFDGPADESKFRKST